MMSIRKQLLWAVLPLAVVLLAPLLAVAEEQRVDWVRVTEHAAWAARDSQGEVVFKDKMWILGGWFDSHQPTPRDVWSSADGKKWDLVEPKAPWTHGDLPMTVVFDGKMWFMGGWKNGRLPGHSASNEVWCSEDGAKWRQVTARAGWSPRLAAGIVEFRNKMWILGGSENYYFGDARSLKNDVWSSSDGQHWKQETANAPWAPRAYHQAVVLNDKMYVMGGGNYVPNYEAHNDVWCSADGAHWERLTAAASWAPRLWFSAVAYRNCIWVLGGWSNEPSKNWGDVWYSADGKSWTELKSDKLWKARHEHSAFVFDDKIWVAGGMIWPLTNEVWSLALPKDWRPARSPD
jgi:hypothetical protein